MRATPSATTLTDPILRLTEYWLSAKLMHAHVHFLRDLYSPGLSQLEDSGDQIEFFTYLQYWLSALYVVAEGYVELGLKDPQLTKLVTAHIDSLRLYRNATFHFQIKPDKHVQFFDGTGDRLNWAEELHATFEEFFSRYAGDVEETGE